MLEAGKRADRKRSLWRLGKPDNFSISCSKDMAKLNPCDRHDFYQTTTTVIASLYLKKIDKSRAKVEFTSPTTISLDLPTTDQKRYAKEMPLFGSIDQAKSMYKIMGTKLELTLVKADGAGWPTLRSDEHKSNEIIQVGQAAMA